MHAGSFDVTLTLEVGLCVLHVRVNVVHLVVQVLLLALLEGEHRVPLLTEYHHGRRYRHGNEEEDGCYDNHGGEGVVGDGLADHVREDVGLLLELVVGEEGGVVGGGPVPRLLVVELGVCRSEPRTRWRCRGSGWCS